MGSYTETIEEAQARLTFQCRWCSKMLHYMEFTRQGLCPECALKSLAQDGQLQKQKEVTDGILYSSPK